MAKHLGTQKNIRFSDEELALLERHADKHGTIKAAVMAGLQALEQRNEPSQADIIDWIRRNTK